MKVRRLPHLIFSGYKQHGADYKRILNDLIEEDFTSRTFDNIKALYLVVRGQKQLPRLGVKTYRTSPHSGSKRRVGFRSPVDGRVFLIPQKFAKWATTGETTSGVRYRDVVC